MISTRFPEELIHMLLNREKLDTAFLRAHKEITKLIELGKLDQAAEAMMIIAAMYSRASHILSDRPVKSMH